jgi:hypothetical protein
MSTLCRPGNRIPIIAFLMLMSAAVYGCGGGPESDKETSPHPNIPQTQNWDRFDVLDLGGDAASVPNVRAHVDSQGYVHLFYYKLGEQHDGRVRYQIHHAVWDSQTLALVGEEEMLDVTPAYPNDGDSGLNNSLVLDAGVTTDGLPIVAYQGGRLAGTPGGELACNQTSQGDIMLNLFNGSNWNEYLGIYGDADAKNPYFTDGYVGTHGSLAVDSQDRIHMVAQFYYEMCDEHARNNPDLMYVRQTMNQLDGSYSTGWEQLVDDHNVYTGTFASNVTQMGYFCDLTLDLQDHPIIVYMGTPGPDEQTDPVTSLRMAHDDDGDGQWTIEVIEELRNWQVKRLSVAVAPDGTIGVAYFMEEIDDTDFPNHLRYAYRQPGGEWENDIVDVSSHCGDFPSLAFDANSLPVIAYYDIHANSGSYRPRKDLRFARYNGGPWKKETVASAGDIGRYNAVWIDADNLINICTYELNNQQIAVFREQPEQ